MLKDKVKIIFVKRQFKRRANGAVIEWGPPWQCRSLRVRSTPRKCPSEKGSLGVGRFRRRASRGAFAGPRTWPERLWKTASARKNRGRIFFQHDFSSKFLPSAVPDE
jgi:hypothetical protein